MILNYLIYFLHLLLTDLHINIYKKVYNIKFNIQSQSLMFYQLYQFYYIVLYFIILYISICLFIFYFDVQIKNFHLMNKFYKYLIT